jgi:hypothetical protein
MFIRLFNRQGTQTEIQNKLLVFVFFIIVFYFKNKMSGFRFAKA